ncbi:TPA: HigA family addiction module antitoxin [Salmonella enterica subsp. enterica serovar Muenchen]
MEKRRQKARRPGVTAPHCSGKKWYSVYCLNPYYRLKGLFTMKNPVHPGEVLREDVIAEPGLSVTGAAARPGMSRAALSRVLNCHAAVSPDLALRLEIAGVSTARA